MKFSTHKLLSLSLAGGLWFTGCNYLQHTDHDRTTCSSCKNTNPRPVYPDAGQARLITDLRIPNGNPQGVAIAAAPMAIPVTPPPMSLELAQAPALPPPSFEPTAESSPPTVATDAPVVTTVASKTAGESVTPTDLVTTSAEGDSWSAVGSAPSARPTSSTAPAPSTPAVPSPLFSHSNDYSVLSGVVQSCQNGWRLRYASFDSEDKYGGCVILDGLLTAGLHDGLQVQVEGTLIPAGNRNDTPLFQARKLEYVKR